MHQNDLLKLQHYQPLTPIIDNELLNEHCILCDDSHFFFQAKSSLISLALIEHLCYMNHRYEL